jgi:hypothetical protein
MTGPFMGAGATLCWGLDNNLTQKVSAGDPVQIAMLKGLAAGSVNTAIALALGTDWPTLPRVGAALVLGFLSYGVSLVFFVLALRHLDAARTGAYFAAAPFVGAAVSLAVLGEWPSVAFAAGAALMAVGVWLHVTERHEHEHRHEAMEHEHLYLHDEHHRHTHARRPAEGAPLTPAPARADGAHAPALPRHPPPARARVISGREGFRAGGVTELHLWRKCDRSGHLCLEHRAGAGACLSAPTRICLPPRAADDGPTDRHAPDGDRRQSSPHRVRRADANILTPNAQTERQPVKRLGWRPVGRLNPSPTREMDHGAFAYL